MKTREMAKRKSKMMEDFIPIHAQTYRAYMDELYALRDFKAKIDEIDRLKRVVEDQEAELEYLRAVR